MAAALPVSAQELYGRLWLEAQRHTSENVRTLPSGTTLVADDSAFALRSNSSRLGLRGHSERGAGGLRFEYQFEAQIDQTGESNPEVFRSLRNSFVGIAGAWGTVRIGKYDTPFKKSQGKFDVASSLAGDVKQVWTGENRADSMISYRSPRVYGVKYVVQIIAAEGSLTEGVSSSVSWSTDRFELAGSLNSNVFGRDGQRVFFSFKSPVTVGVILHATQDAEVSGDDETGYGVSVKYNWGAHSIGGQYLTVNRDALLNQDGSVMQSRDGTSVSVVYTHNITKKGNWYAHCNRHESDEPSESSSTIGVGVRYKFTIGLGK